MRGSLSVILNNPLFLSINSLIGNTKSLSFGVAVDCRKPYIKLESAIAWKGIMMRSIVSVLARMAR